MDEESKKEMIELKAKVKLQEQRLDKLSELLIEESIISREELEQDQE